MSTVVKSEKKENFSCIYREIYAKRIISKQQIANNLNLSLPTVSQNLELLEKSGLIIKKGFYESTGGRPASAYTLNEKYKVSVGVELLASGVNLALVDLYGNEYKVETINLTFCPIEQYYRKLGERINAFIKRYENPSNVLGVDFAIPGIISEDKGHIIFAEVLKTNDINLSDLTKYLDFPCAFYHDAEANTEAELWLGEKMENAHYIFLNNFLCNALVLDGKIQKNKSLSSGTIEHLVLHTNGRQCYCGKKGCVDSYCSANSLQELSGTTSLDNFFMDLRRSDKHALAVWDTYLDNLAQTIDAARMIIACDVVLGGRLQHYMLDEDIKKIKEKVINITTFKNSDFTLKKGICGKNFTIIGATIPRISKFILSI